MCRLSLIISEIYNKYLPLAEKGNIALNLDFSDTTKTVDDPETIKADLDKHLSSALNRSGRGEISITVEEDAIVVIDSGTTLSKPICALLSKGRVHVNSRVGFGTTVRISLLPPPPNSSPSPAQKSQPEQLKPAKKPQPTKQLKSANKSQPTKKAKPTKPTREQRKLTAAAKKANRKIQKIRQSQQQRNSKPERTTKRKPAQKTRKKILELS